MNDRSADADTASAFGQYGEMRQRWREFDWAATPLGPIAGWQASLRTTVELVLGSGFPMVVLWGPELIQIYNDAYVPFLAAKHPDGLGISNRVCWPEVWHINAPIYERVFAGETVSLQDALYPVNRQGTGGPAEDLYITLSYSPAPNDSGGVGGVLVTLFDTTAQVTGRLAEAERDGLAAALEAERTVLLETVFRRAPSFLAVYHGPDHVFALANEAYVQLIGHGRDFLGKPLLEALPEIRGQGFDVLLDHVLETGEPFVAEEIPVRLERTPGAPAEDRVVALTYIPLVEPNGRRTGIIAHGTDVTAYVRARRDAELLLAAAERERESTARLQALTAALAGAHTLDDVSTVVVAEMVEALGARTGAFAVPTSSGDGLVLARQVGFPDSVTAFIRVQPLALQSPLTECFRTRSPIWIETRDGPAGLDVRYPLIAPVWDVIGTASAAFVPLLIAGEEVGVISFAFEDARVFGAPERAFFLALAQQAALAVDRARLFSAEHAARREAEAANRTKADFLATMSHELRTPLNAIGGYAELIGVGVYGLTTVEQRTALDRIQRSQRHLLELINGVLSYAKVDAGAVNYIVESVQMNEVLTTCEVLVAPQVRRKELAFKYVDCEPELSARADREKLRQIVLNLLSNAIKFTAPGGSVTLMCAAPDGRVTVRVVDTGQGIAPDQLERVFQPFVQIDARLTRTQEGTGLGLAISRELARGMGGELTVESTPGVGSTFTITLPRG